MSKNIQLKTVAKSTRASVSKNPKKVGRSAKRRNRNRASARQGDLGAGAISTMFAPVSEGTILKSLKPQFFRSGDKEQRIVHREKVGKYITPGNGAFTQLASIALNPGLNTSFPWLSNEASGWEKYRFDKLRYIWVPAVGTQVAGDIIMGPDYDAADAAPYGETALSSYQDTEEGNVWCRFAATLDPKSMNDNMRDKYLRFGNLGPNLDVKTYDSGNFFLYSSDDTAANTGKLWVEYDVTLINPQVPPGGFQASGVLVSGGGSVASATPFGSVPVASGPIILAAAATNVVSLSNVQVGQEILTLVTVAGTTITGCAAGTYVGCSVKSGVSSLISASGLAAALWQTLSITAPNPTFTITNTAVSITSANCFASALAP